MTYSIADEILSELNIPASMKTIKKIMDNSLEKWFGLNFSRDILYCPYHKTTYTFEKAELDEFPHCLKPKSEALINMYESIESSLAAIVLNKDSMKRINEFRKKTNGREKKQSRGYIAELTKVFMKDLENLQENGINIKDEDGNEIFINANLIVATGDLPAVASILERNSATSLHPCSFCNIGTI
ncbi:hypothetical protein C6P40_001512 [Pichia californica]|uniref:Uncharacterized protein n=1 Tax=Pichia californica TaxID=460514 RepID=A0A9P6WL41_9ASCO|nr:hypothetical protein C6P42_003924 [[Candida] californica]KAG0688018.1 hypothetical protein C6P40_001512 [[Candida] californica]